MWVLHGLRCVRSTRSHSRLDGDPRTRRRRPGRERIARSAGRCTHVLPRGSRRCADDVADLGPERPGAPTCLRSVCATGPPCTPDQAEAAEAIPALVGAAAAVADGVDVLGLAVDGGYWVIGLGTADRAVFGAVPMSTSRTGLAQLRRLHQLGRRVRMLPMAHDLDTFDDVRTAARCQPDTRLGMLARQVIEDS